MKNIATKKICLEKLKQPKRSKLEKTAFFNLNFKAL